MQNPNLRERRLRRYQGGPVIGDALIADRHLVCISHRTVLGMQAFKVLQSVTLAPRSFGQLAIPRHKLANRLFGSSLDQGDCLFSGW
jgi:hypothetical protein